MATCDSSDISKLSANEYAIGICFVSSATMSTLLFPPGSVIQSCFASAGISRSCTSCWSDYCDSSNTCFLDTCGFTYNGTDLIPPNDPLTQECIDCFTNISQTWNNETAIVCGVGNELFTSIQNQTEHGGKSVNRVSIKSIVMCAMFFSLLILS
jgi:hypothetical protein